MHIEECTRCRTPKLPGHRLVCVLHAIAEISFWAGILCLLAFWIALAGTMANLMTDDLVMFIILMGSNAVLLMVLSLATSMRARWLRHSMVADLEDYLDEQGSCCGGSCAGSCSDGGCSTGGCDDGACGADEPELASDDAGEEGGCCGGGCCK